MDMLTRGKCERGAIIIHVAFALLALLAFSAFVVDMGVMWVSRRPGTERGRCRCAGRCGGVDAGRRLDHRGCKVGASVGE